MGNPKAFETPAYDFLFRRNFEFEKYGRKDIYWIELDYYIDRDYFVSRIGRALDVEMRSYGGLPIFEGATDKEYIAAQNMVLLKETISPQYAYQDVYKVTELYGFAPNVTFEKYGAEVSTVWGREDPSEPLEIPTKDLGFSLYKSVNQVYVPMLSETDTRKFAVGDIVTIRGEYARYSSSGGTTTYIANEFTTNASRVLDIRGNGIFCELFSIGSGEADEKVLGSLNWSVYGTRLDGTYGAIATQKKYLTRIISQMAPRQRLTTYREETIYSTLKPEITERFTPLTSLGAEVDIITPFTRPSISEWLRIVANGEEIVSSDSKIEELYPGLWIKSTKYTKAR